MSRGILSAKKEENGEEEAVQLVFVIYDRLVKANSCTATYAIPIQLLFKV